MTNQSDGLAIMAFNSDSLSIPEDMVDALNNFQQKVGRKNDKHGQIVKQNPFANNADYYPIGYLQMKMDQVFLGLWNWKINSVQVAGNAVVVYGDLSYFHPVAKTWITRSGVGAMPVELKSGSNPNDAQNINHKAMQKNVPAADGYAFKNAAQKIGNLFGRHLNRKEFGYDFVADKPVNA